MHYSTLRTVGGSVMFAIPKPVLDMLGLRPNAEVGITVADGRLIVDPQAKPRYTLEELIGQCDLAAPLTKEEQAWLDDGPAGGEAI
ncbi:AbrB/MazE/SpoVT family DNA-binding domain-containing protein [Planctomyces sp. SH-PL62]|uniref:AbrB/MazE/SpoVT family DNA-binding domain-containing protein n=1 Tax=Planctomyces sp. SH-PL62 TaxID=1636152 RepID=UPI00078EEB7C|nr:antitoxin [Planctomyces sp. SH-PL62]AMV40238.1 Antitoxin PemI [Planctomyces sp. SH-PL62]